MVNYPYSFEWDHKKDRGNLAKHRVDFASAQEAFLDPCRIVLKDARHSREEEIRYFCLWLVEGKIHTVRFTFRHGRIRIFGAGFWREGRRIYEKENNLQQGP